MPILDYKSPDLSKAATPARRKELIEEIICAAIASLIFITVMALFISMALGSMR